MKRFLNGVLKWKNYASLIFTGWICAYGAIAYLFGEREISIGTLFQILVISLVGSLLQGIAFEEEWLIRKMGYGKRMLLFVAMFLPVLSVFAVLFRWFPTANLMAWAIFLLIFVIILVVMTLGFEIMFRITGKKYNGLLGEYKKKHDVGAN